MLHQLVYRGNFEVTAGIDYADSHLRADYGGGLSETEVVFPPRRFWRLSYPALSRDVSIQLPSGEAVTRHDYVWDFYRHHMDAGNLPFVMRCPRDKKLYLCEFEDTRLEYSLVDLFLATSGLSIRQAAVRGVLLNPDGSVVEGVTV